MSTPRPDLARAEAFGIAVKNEDGTARPSKEIFDDLAALLDKLTHSEAGSVAPAPPGPPPTLKCTTCHSTAVKNPQDWADVGILIPHEILRQGMLDAVEHSQPTVLTVVEHPWKLEAFFKWFGDFVALFVEDHHKLEEEIYFPWLATKEALPEKIAADHSGLMKLLHEVQGGKEAIGSADDKAAAVSSFHETVRKLNDEMAGHLTEEEEFIPGILRKHFTQDQEQGIIGQIMQKIEPNVHAHIDYWIIWQMRQWAGEEYAAWFSTVAFPPHLKEKLDGDFKSLFEKEYLGALASIKSSTPQ